MSEYSLITHALQKSIVVDGKEYAIDTRTCKALQCSIFMEDDEVPMPVKIQTIVEMMVLNHQMLTVGSIDEAFQKIIEFLDGYPQGRKSKSTKQILSCEQDHSLIVAGFQQAYGISLDELKSMHWWRFLALLGGLPECTRIAEVMKVRAMPINPKDSPEQRMAKIKAKQSVALAPKRRKTNQSGVDVISQALDAEGF